MSMSTQIHGPDSTNQARIDPLTTRSVPDLFTADIHSPLRSPDPFPLFPITTDKEKKHHKSTKHKKNPTQLTTNSYQNSPSPLSLTHNQMRILQLNSPCFSSSSSPLTPLSNFNTKIHKSIKFPHHLTPSRARIRAVETSISGAVSDADSPEEPPSIDFAFVTVSFNAWVSSLLFS